MTLALPGGLPPVFTWPFVVAVAAVGNAGR